MKRYTIKEAAELLQLSTHTLRYYDEIGVLTPKREPNGYRYYSEVDIKKTTIFVRIRWF